MTDIPDDIMEAAREIVGRIEKVHIWKGDAIADVAQAIMRERERCAQIAEDIAGEADGGEFFIANRIASAIRSPDTAGD